MEVAERLIGDPEQLAEIAGMNPKAGYNWRRRSNWRDAGDMPPRTNRALLEYSAAGSLGLTADHLINGATVAEVEAILSRRQKVAA